MAQGLINNGVSITKSFSPNEYELLADYTVDVARTSYTFSGLNINADEEIVLVVSFVANGANDIFIYANGNTTPTNYYAQYMYASSSSVGGSRINSPYLTGAAGTSLCISKVKLTNNGYFVYQAESIREVGTSNTHIYNFSGTSTFTLSQITSVTFIGASSGIGIGSRFQLYKVKGQVQQTWATT